MNPFRRGREITRLEGFSDAVFGFALTLLVVSLEVPSSYEDLMKTMRGFAGFACCFAIVAWLWFEHNLFFRRYGLQDGVTIVLNFILLFVVLFYVYPLKFIFTRMMAGLFEADGPSGYFRYDDGRTLMLVYSSALIVLFAIYALLYLYALRRREDLSLDRMEIFDAWTGFYRHLLMVLIGVISITVVVTRPRDVEWAGFVYFLIGPAQGVLGFARGSQRARVAASG